MLVVDEEDLAYSVSSFQSCPLCTSIRVSYLHVLVQVLFNQISWFNEGVFALLYVHTIKLYLLLH